MNVIRAKVLGFCMGVRRAVDIASCLCNASGAEAEYAAGHPAQLPAEHPAQLPAAGRRVFTLGPLIHNPQALEDLRRRGISVLDEQALPASLAGASVIIRAHGVSPQTEAELRKRGGRVIDATCPKVKASQLKAKALAEAGYRIFLAGEAAHAEIAGIVGYVRSGFASGCETPGSGDGVFCAVVGNAAEAEAAALRAVNAASESCAAVALRAAESRAALIAQTTISEAEYRDIGEAIKKYFPNLEIIQTICAATTDRQEALRALLDQVDAVIVAGGKESANTRRLQAIAEGGGKPCVLAESASDIPASFADFKTVGLCAGASTPDAVIEEIERALKDAG
jgi:4-hydroxy-3-methylbut-2-enyl diphosphate reductase